MGNQNCSKRTYRKEFGHLFEGLIKIHKIKQAENPDQKKMEWKPEFQCDNLKVIVRKRPLFDYEAEKGEFDVITTHENRIAEVHDGRMGPDMKPMKAFMEHLSIPFPPGSVFDEKCSTKDIYESSLQALTSKFVEGQENVTTFMFGQTGSGKTYTICGIMELLAKDLFALLKTTGLQISCFGVEIIGDNLFDLLSEARNKVNLMENSKGFVEVVGVQSFFVPSAENLVDSYMFGANNRETHATQCNSTSSRSHYIFTIRLVNPAQPEAVLAQFTLLDLAGSERNENTLYHQADRIKEQCQINTSLMCLKNCMEGWADNHKNGKNARIPFRDSKLTLFLRDSFITAGSKATKTEKNEKIETDEEIEEEQDIVMQEGEQTAKPCTLVVIATVSPSSTDTEHSITTLKHTSALFCDNSQITTEKYVVEDYINQINNLSKGKNILEEEEKLVEVVLWDNARTMEWVSSVSNGEFAEFAGKFPSTCDGKQLSRYTAQRLAQIMGNQEAGQKLRDEIVAEMNRITNEKRKRVNEKKAIVKPKGMY